MIYKTKNKMNNKFLKVNEELHSWVERRNASCVSLAPKTTLKEAKEVLSKMFDPRECSIQDLEFVEVGHE